MLPLQQLQGTLDFVSLAGRQAVRTVSTTAFRTNPLESQAHDSPELKPQQIRFMSRGCWMEAEKHSTPRPTAQRPIVALVPGKGSNGRLQVATTAMFLRRSSASASLIHLRHELAIMEEFAATCHARLDSRRNTLWNKAWCAASCAISSSCPVPDKRFGIRTL